MPTRTGTGSNLRRSHDVPMRGEEQVPRARLNRRRGSAYRPGEDYQPWDEDTGNLRLANDGDSYDHTYSDNYQDDNLYDDRLGDRTYEQSSGNRSSALSTLRDAENGAAAGREPNFYTGKGRAAAPTSKSKVKAKGQKTKLAVISAIAALFIGGGAFLGSSNSLLAPAMEALFTEATDTQYASASMRSTRLMRYYLSDTGATATTWTGAKKYTAMSGTFKRRLAKQGITIEGHGTNKTLVYTKTGADGVEVTQRITAADFDNAYMNDVDFRDSYTTAKRGRVATFFDNIANKIYQKLGISRNLFANFKQTGDSDADMAKYKDTMSPKFEVDDTSIAAGGNEERTEIVRDENGDPVIDSNGNVETTTVEDRVTDSASVKNSNATDFLNKASMVSDALNIGCAIMKVGNLISVTIAANEIYQSINYFMGLMENVSKMKAGYGDESALNEVLNFLSSSTTTTYADANDISSGETEITGAPLQSNGMQLVLAGAPANSNTTNQYSLERVSGATQRALKATSYTLGACAAAGIATSAVSLGISVATLGASGLIKVAAGLFTNAVGAVAINATITTVLGFLIPTIAQTLFTNVFENATGIPAGELFTRGSSAANTRLGRSGSGQSLSSKDAALTYNKVNNTILALDAEVERKNHSPFDATNKNTFFGSIAYSLLPSITTSKTTSISALARTTSNSITSLLGGTAYADGENTSYMTTFGDCPDLESIGAVGDIYCNPVTSTDINTLDLSPTDSTYQDVINAAQDCDSDGNCTIKDDSDLARYITYCDGRDSPFGVMDNSILSDFDFTSGNGIIDSALNSLPFIGDAIGILDGLNELDPDHQAWANGQHCGNTTENNNANNNYFWDSKGKYYQRYVEDMRLLEEMGAFEETDSRNPVTAYEEKYATEHPLDTSREGIIAHYTGMSKPDAELMVALIDYVQFLDDYDASTRIALEGDTTSPKTSSNTIAKWEQGTYKELQKGAINNPLETRTIARQNIVYFDIRNRSYAA